MRKVSTAECAIAAVNGIDASQWTLFMAWLFGRKERVFDGRNLVTWRIWRGKKYMFNVEEQ